MLDSIYHMTQKITLKLRFGMRTLRLSLSFCMQHRYGRIKECDQGS